VAAQTSSDCGTDDPVILDTRFWFYDLIPVTGQ